MNEDKGQGERKIHAFDSHFSSNHIQILKLILAYLPSFLQPRLAVYIKYLELCQAFSFCTQNFGVFNCQPETDTEKLFTEILPYCSAQEKERVEQILSALSSLKDAKEMMEMLQSAKELFPDGFSASGDMQGMDLSELLDIFFQNNGPKGGQEDS